MASTFSPILRIELIGTGDQSGTWGSTTNVNLGTLIEQAIAGTATIDVTAGNVTLTNYNGTTDEARCAALRITGIPGASRNVIAPAVSKLYVVANGSDAAVVLKTSVSTGLTIPSGEVYLAYYDPTVGTADFRLVGRASASTNTANTLVLRDGSGNFAASTITATTFSGQLSGTITSATTATTQTAGDNSTKVATTAYVGTAITNATASLGTMSTQNASSVAITGGTIDNVTTSGSSTSAVTGLGYLGMPQDAQSSGYTLALSDAGKHVYYTGGAATLTVPTNGSVALPVGTVITVINNGTGSLTIGTTSLTVYFAGTALTGNRTLATKGMATLIKVATDTWFISGVGLS